MLGFIAGSEWHDSALREPFLICRFFSRRRRKQGEKESATDAEFAFCPYRTAMLFHNCFRDCQSQSGTEVSGGLGLPIPFKNAA